MNAFTRRLAALVVAVGLGAGAFAATGAPAQAAIDTSWGRGAVAPTDTTSTQSTDGTQELDTSWGRGFTADQPTVAMRADTKKGRASWRERGVQGGENAV